MIEEKSLSLYELTNELYQLEKLIDLAEDGDDEKIMELQSTIHGLLMNKVDNVCAYDDYLEDLIEIAKKREQDIKELRLTLEKRRESYNKYIRTCMENINTKEIRGTLRKVVINKPKKIVEVLNHANIPDEYLDIKKVVTPRKTFIYEALTTGQEVPGCRLADGNIKVHFKKVTK